MGAMDAYRTCLVTGASAGLGAVLAERLLRRGHTVWGTARDVRRLSLPGLRPLELDLFSRDSVNAFIESRLPECGEIDLLVNNAGSGLFGSFERFDNGQIERQMQLLLMVPMIMVRAVLPGMLGRGRGCVVNVSSLAGRFPLPCLSVYNGAKAGLSAFSLSLAEELRGTGVRVVDFQPGDFRTGFNDNMARNGGSAAAWAALERHLHSAPDAGTIAGALLRALDAGATGTVKAGGFFQTRMAPLGQRLLPGSVFRALSRAYQR
jgi:short-subunit dehydrogenase